MEIEDSSALIIKIGRNSKQRGYRQDEVGGWGSGVTSVYLATSQGSLYG